MKEKNVIEKLLELPEEKLEQYITLTKYKIEWNNKHSKCCVCGKNIQERDKDG